MVLPDPFICEDLLRIPRVHGRPFDLNMACIYVKRHPAPWISLEFYRCAWLQFLNKNSASRKALSAERAHRTHNYAAALRKLERNANNNGIRAVIRGFFLYIQQGGAAARETSFWMPGQNDKLPSG